MIVSVVVVCPLPECGWQWIAPFDTELGKVCDATRIHCWLCAREHTLTVGQVVQPTAEDEPIPWLGDTDVPLSPDEHKRALRLGILVEKKELRLMRGMLGNIPVGILLEREQINEQMRDVPVAILVNTSLLRVLRRAPTLEAIRKESDGQHSAIEQQSLPGGTPPEEGSGGSPLAGRGSESGRHKAGEGEGAPRRGEGAGEPGAGKGRRPRRPKE